MSEDEELALALATSVEAHEPTESSDVMMQLYHRRPAVIESIPASYNLVCCIACRK